METALILFAPRGPVGRASDIPKQCHNTRDAYHALKFITFRFSQRSSMYFTQLKVIWDWSNICIGLSKKMPSKMELAPRYKLLKFILHCIVCVYFILYTSYNFTAYVRMMNIMAQIHFQAPLLSLTHMCQPTWPSSKGTPLICPAGFSTLATGVFLIFKLKTHKHYSLRITKNLFNCHRCSFKCDLNAITFFKRSLARKSWNGWNTIIIVIITVVIVVIVIVNSHSYLHSNRKDHNK